MVNKKEDINLMLANVSIANADGKNVNLKDFAIILDRSCGHGVSWQLAHELATRLELNYESVCIVIDDIVDKYIKMDNEEAINAFENNPIPQDYYFTYFIAKTMGIIK